MSKNDDLRSENKHLQLINHMPAGYALHEIICNDKGEPVDYRFLEVNPAFEKLTGLKAQDIVGKTCLEVLPGTESVWIQKYGKVALTGETTHFDSFSNVLGRHYEVTAFQTSPGHFACTFHDITERKKSKKTLLESEEKYRSLVEGSLQGMVLAQNDPIRITYASSPMEAITGYSPDEIISLSPEELIAIIHEDDRADFFKGFTDRIAGEHVESNKKYRLIHKNGSVRWIELYSTLIQYNGEPAIQTAFVDITERKNAETLLKESEQELRSYIDNAPDGVFVADESGHYIDVNKAAEMITGYSRNELLSMSIPDLYPQETVEEEMKSFSVIKKAGKVRVEKRFLHKNGSIRWWLIEGVKLSETRYLGFTKDITERKEAEYDLRESEERYRSIFENSLSIHLLIDPVNGNIVDSNAAACQFYGYTQEQMKKMTIMDINTLPRNDVQNKIKKVQINKKHLFEFRHKLANGQIKDVEVYSGLVPIKGKKYLYSIIHDISKRKTAEENIKKGEVQYKDLVNTINSGVAVYKVSNNGDLGKDYIIQDFNRTALEMENLQKEDAVGNSLVDIRPNIDDYGLIPIFQKVWKTGEPAFFPAKQYVDDKYSNYYENRVFKLPDGNIVAVYDDVTDRENALIKMKQSKERLDLAINATKDGIYDWNLRTNEIYYSPPYKNMLGYKDDELPNDFSVWEKLTDPEDVKRSWKMLKEMINNKRSDFEMEFKMKHKNGHWVDILSRAKAVFDENGKAVRVIGTHVDITQRKKAELILRKNKQIIDSTSDAILTTDPKGIIKSCNAACEKIYGYSSKELIGKNVSILYANKDLPRLNQMIENLLNGKKDLGIEVSLVRKDKSTIPLSLALSTIKDENGKIIELVGDARDITERKLTEQELLKNQYYLEKSQELGKIGTWELDIINNNLYWTEENYKVFGVPFGTPMNYELFLEIVHPDDREAINEEWSNALKKKPYEVEHRLLVDNKVIWVKQKAEIKFDEAGNAISAIGFSQDITNSKMTEEDIKAKSIFLESLIEQSPLPTFVLDSKGITVMANRAFMNFFAVPDPKMVLDQNALTDPANISHGVVKYLEEALSGKIVEMPEIEFVAPHNLKRSITKCKLFPIFDSKGKLTNVVGMQEDITDRKDAVRALKESEMKFRALFEQTGGYCMVLDPNTPDGIPLIIDANEAACSIHGYKKEELIGKPVSKIDDEEGKLLVKKRTAEIMTGKPFYVENTHVRKNGTTFTVAVNAKRIDIGNAPPLIFTVEYDITEKKNLEEAMQRSQKLESLGILAGGIAHDFNNILSAIFGFTELAVMKSTENEISDYLDKSLSNIERARALTQQLLTFSKGGTPVKKVEKLFPFVQETVRFALSGSSVSSKFMIDDNLWACNIDKNQIGQVVDNLTINAQQAMPNGGTINIQAKNISLSEKEHPSLVANNYVKLSIQDQGIGIPKEFLSRIFDPYFTTKSKGHGLGLSTCYSIINRHGGSIDVDSEPGKGSTFNIYIPATTEDVSAIEERSAKRHLGSGTFLVMDDDKAILDLMVEMIESLGYNVVSMTNGADALDFFKAEFKAGRKVAGMIFDLTIPGGMGGKETIKEIRKICLETPVFVSSGYSEDPIVAHPQDHGFNASIRKPFMMTDLSEMLEKHKREI